MYTVRASEVYNRKAQNTGNNNAVYTEGKGWLSRNSRQLVFFFKKHDW
jgi:hypothetical protein